MMRTWTKTVLLLAAALVVLSAQQDSWATPLAAAAAHGDEPQLINGPPKGLVTAVTTLAIFVLLLVVLARFAWRPIAEGLQAREDRIRKDLADAEAARARAEATLREYTKQLESAEERIRQMYAEAAQQVEKENVARRLRAQQEAEEIKERAMREIDNARKEAVRELHEQAADLATRVAEKILRRSLNPDDHRDLVHASLDQLEGVGRS